MNFRKAIPLYVLASLFLFFEMGLQVSPSVISSQLMHTLNIGSFGLGLMSGCYFYTYALMQLPSGYLFDHFNPKKIIVISILTCVAGNTLLAFSAHFYLSCFARLLMGAGSAFAFVSVLVVTKDLFCNRYFALMTGITQTLAALGAMSGQLPVSLLVDSLHWQKTLLLLSGLGFVLAMAILVFLNYEPISKKEEKVEEPQKGFYLKTILKNPQTWTVGAYALLMWAPMSGFASLWGVPFLKAVDHLNCSSAALLCSLMWLGLAFASPILGQLSTRIQNRKWPLFLSALVGMLSFGALLFLKLDLLWLGVALFISGAACAGQALSFTAIKENNSPKIVASAIAFNNMAVVISGAAFQPLIGWLLAHTGLTHVEHFKEALSVVFVAYVLAAAVALIGIQNSYQPS